MFEEKVPSQTYRVVWDDHEGQRQEQCFANPRDAYLEAAGLLENGGHVEVVPPGTGVRFELDPDLLASAVEIMRDAQAYYEADACALARLDSPEARELAQERLKSAKLAETLLYFFGTQ